MRTPLDPDPLEWLEAELGSLRPLQAGDTLRDRVGMDVARQAPLQLSRFSPRAGATLSTAAGLAALAVAGLWGVSRREPPLRLPSTTPAQAVSNPADSACECRVRFSAGTPLRSGGFG